MSEGTQAAPPAADSLSVEVREDGGATRWLEVEVPPARTAKSFERAYRGLARSARVRGFRPGKAPLSVLRRLYGSAVAEEVERELVAETLPEALERTGLAPVSEPSVDATVPAEGASFAYRARIEVMPEIPLGDVTGLPAQRPSVVVAESEVDEELETLRQKHAVLVEEPEDTAAQRGHHLTVDFVGRIDGDAFEGGSAQDHTVELGSEQWIPGFEDQLVGARAGEDRTVQVQFPDDYGSPVLAGKAAEFAVHVHALRRREVPALDDEFAKDLGDFETLADVREKIRETLLAAKERRARLEVRRTLLGALIERVPFEVPANLLRERLERRIHSAAHDLEKRGMPRELVGRQLARLEEDWRPLVEREVREEWLLQTLAKRESLQVDDVELDARIAQMAEAQGTNAERLREAYRSAEVLEALRGQILEDKAFEFLLAAASVEDVSDS